MQRCIWGCCDIIFYEYVSTCTMQFIDTQHTLRVSPCIIRLVSGLFPHVVHFIHIGAIVPLPVWQSWRTQENRLHETDGNSHRKYNRAQYEKPMWIFYKYLFISTYRRRVITGLTLAKDRACRLLRTHVLHITYEIIFHISCHIIYVVHQLAVITIICWIWQTDFFLSVTHPQGSMYKITVVLQ